MAHVGKGEMSNDEFNQKWNHISNMLVKRGDSYAEIKALKIELMKIGKIEVRASNNESVVENKAVEEDKTDNAGTGIDLCGSDSVKEVKEETVEIKTTPIKQKCLPEKKCEACDHHKAEYKNLKDEANKYFKANDLNKAIEIYSQILQLPGVLPEEKATIFNNRSVAYLSLKTDDSIKLAQKDAEWSIQLWPCGWRGYYRLARTQITLEKYAEAEKSLENALALNPSSKDARNELSAVRAKIGVASRSEHLNSAYQIPSENEQLNTVVTRLGISKKLAKKLLNKSMDLPIVGDTLRGKHYLAGSNGLQQDYSKAAYHFEKAARAGDTDAMYCLGKLYSDGKGIPQDFKKSMDLLLRAANSTPESNVAIGTGIPEAQHSLGLRYSEGIGVEKNYQKAREWYEKAVDHGSGASANNLGIFYQNGNGVKKSPEKAFHYFKLAATLGDAQAMLNLAGCYLTAEGTESNEPSDEYFAEGSFSHLFDIIISYKTQNLALKWLEFSAKNGNMNAESHLEKLKKMDKNKQRLVSHLNKIERNKPAKKDLLDKEQYGAAIKEAAKNGSVTAQRHVNIWKNIEMALEAFKKNDSAAVVSALSEAIRLDHQITKVPEILYSIIEERMASHDDEIETITCFIHINRNRNRNNLIYFNSINKYWPLFRKDKYLLEQRITSFIVQNKLQEALIVVNKALEFYPKSLRFLYCRVIVLCNQKNDESIIALDKFINAAPKDHDKVPACYYRKATFYYDKNNIPKFIESYESGMAAENKQLPCFLPCDFPEKVYFKNIYLNEKNQRVKQASSSIPSTSQRHCLNKIKLDPQRKLLIAQHRDLFISEMKIQSALSITATIAKTPNTPQRPRLDSLKKITLKEMNPAEDKVYDGYVLEARIIEWAFVMTGITTVIEDENGDLQRLSIYNWPSKGNKIFDNVEALTTFRPNNIISIINPYLRLTKDMQSSIRVESPGHIHIVHWLIRNVFVVAKKQKFFPAQNA